MKKHCLIALTILMPLFSLSVATSKTSSAKKQPANKIVGEEVASFIEAQGEALVAFLESCSNHEFFAQLGFTQKDLHGGTTHLSGEEAKNQIIKAGKQLATMGAQAATFLHDSIATMEQKIEEKRKKRT